MIIKLISFNLKNEECHLKNYKKWSCIAVFTLFKNIENWKAKKYNESFRLVIVWLLHFDIFTVETSRQYSAARS